MLTPAVWERTSGERERKKRDGEEERGQVGKQIRGVVEDGGEGSEKWRSEKVEEGPKNRGSRFGRWKKGGGAKGEGRRGWREKRKNKQKDNETQKPRGGELGVTSTFGGRGVQSHLERA